MKNLTYKQLLALVDDVLNGRWEGDTSKPIMIWFWTNPDLDTVKKQLDNIRELASFHGHPIRHCTKMILGDEVVKVADHPEYAEQFILPSSFHSYTKGFLYHQYVEQLSPKYLFDCKEVIEHTGMPLIGLVNDYEKEACEEKGAPVDMGAFVNYRYIGKTVQDWLEEVTVLGKDGLPQLLPCITDFVSDEHIRDLFFYNGDETDSIASDKRIFSPDSWKHVMHFLWESYVDYHEDVFGSKYNNSVDFLNGEYGLGLSADATDEEINARMDTLPNALTRRLAGELVGYYDFGGLKKSDSVEGEVYGEMEDFLISGKAEWFVCGQDPFRSCRDFYNQWIDWLKARKAGK